MTFNLHMGDYILNMPSDMRMEKKKEKGGGERSPPLDVKIILNNCC